MKKGFAGNKKGIVYAERALEVGITIKLIDGILQLIGAAILFLSFRSRDAILTRLFRQELIEDPNDMVARGIYNYFHSLPIRVQALAGLLLLVHGGINIGLYFAIHKRKYHWYLVCASVVFVLTIYQLYLFMHTRSILLLLVCIIDAAIIYLLIFDYLKSQGTRRDNKPTRHT